MSDLLLNAMSLCSGIGGLDLAAEMTGHIQTVVFSEIESNGSAIRAG